MLRAVILDDEPAGCRTLQEKLQAYSGTLEVIAVFHDPVDALLQLQQLSLDVLFLDVEMPLLDGFQFLERLPSFSFEVIFVTAYSSYTLNALRVHALDYLLKPVDEDELAISIQRLIAKNTIKQPGTPSLPQHPSALSNRIALSTAEGIHIVKHDHIIRVEASGNYSNFHLSDNRKIIVSKTLGEFETQLSQQSCFMRVNRSCIVNLEFVSKYRRGDGGTLELEDGMEIEVSPTKKEELLKRLII